MPIERSLITEYVSAPFALPPVSRPGARYADLGSRLHRRRRRRGGLWPAPGGLGAVEAATAASLVAAGMHAGAALAAVAVYRLLSFWMLLGIGWVVMAGLSRRPERPDPERPERPALAVLS